jgi:hypothetical protein
MIMFFKGQPIDSPNNGPPPPPWSIPANPPKMFADSVIKIEVPHTAVIKVILLNYSQSCIAWTSSRSWL